MPPAATAVSFARVDAIVKNSNGNWNKVPSSDQKYLIQEFGKGNQRVATMIFTRRAADMAANQRWNKRVDAMIKSSGGNWDKLSPKDRDYLVNIVSKGDFKAAQAMFQDRAAHMKSHH